MLRDKAMWAEFNLNQLSEEEFLRIYGQTKSNFRYLQPLLENPENWWDYTQEVLGYEEQLDLLRDTDPVEYSKLIADIRGRDHNKECYLEEKN